MRLTSSDQREDIDRVSEYIGQQATFLVLDNCEHLIGQVAAVVLRLLSHCHQLTVVATSRERLHLREERVYDLAPLETPGVRADSATVATNPAIYLLRQRAEEAGAEDPLISDLKATVSVSRRLDGLPLAIELAASRLRVMSITELDASLAASLRLLAGRVVDGPPHHITMTATIDWSYQLLDDEVRRVFAPLSVFLGGFDLDAAVVVADFGSRDDAAESLSFLVETSLVQHVSQGRLSRYRMLEPIRQYALVLLGTSEERMRAARARHAHYFRNLAVEAEPHLFGVGQTEWLGRLDRDIDNLRAAYGWFEASERTRLLDFASAMAGHWFHRARFKEGRAALESALSAPSAPDTRRVDGLIGLSQLCWVGSDYRAAANAASEALELAHQFGDQQRAVIAKECLARSWLMMGRTDEAAPLLEGVRSEAHRLGMLRWEADASHFLGFVARQRGKHHLAQQFHQAARSGFEASGDLLSVGFALGAEAVDAWQLGQLDLARKLASESIRIHEEFGEARGAAEGRSVEAMFDLGEGNLSAAYELLLQAFNELRDIGSGRGVAATLTLLARVKTAGGNPRLGAVLIGIAEAIYGGGIEGLPPFVTAGIVSTLEHDLGVDFQPALNEGRAVGWDGLDQWLEQNLPTNPQLKQIPSMPE
jgi:predicted ATPase